MSWRRGQTAILTPSSSSTIAALLSHLGWVTQPWVTEGHKPSVCKLIFTLASYLQLTQTVCVLVILLFKVHLLPLFFRLFSQVHLLIYGSVEGQYITRGLQLWFQVFLSNIDNLYTVIWFKIIIHIQYHLFAPLYGFTYTYHTHITCKL